MKLMLTSLVVALLISSCDSTKSYQKSPNTPVGKYEEVKQQLKDLRQSEIEFVKYYNSSLNEASEEQLNEKRDSHYSDNCDMIKSIFSKYGFVGIDKIGEEGTHNFMEIVIHCFSDNEFQQQVVEEAETELHRKNVKPNDYAILVDKQKVHNREKQIFGTQVITNSDMWVFPTPIFDSLNVNVRRAEIGLSSLEEYLNKVMRIQFDMNKERYKEMGIMTPLQYVEESQ